MGEEQFLSKENMQKFLNDEPYLEMKENRVDFCLGKNLNDAKDIFRQYLLARQERTEK